MADGTKFRAGPAFMKAGQDKAKTNRNIINIADLSVDKQSKSHN